MSGVKKRCQLDGCNRAASTHCFCCNKNVCTRHFTDHIDTVKAQIDPLANDINTMVEKIQGVTIEHLTERPSAELWQWKMDMHKLIDEIFLVKSKEIEDLVKSHKEKFVEHKKQQLETMMKIHDDVKQLVEDGDATFEQIQLLKKQLAYMEINLTSFRNDFLLVNVRVVEHGLVTVSSNLNKSEAPSPFTQTSVLSSTAPSFKPTFGTLTDAQSNPGFRTIGEKPAFFGGFGNTTAQPVSSIAVASTNSPFSFGTTPTTTTSAGGEQRFYFGAPAIDPPTFGTGLSSFPTFTAHKK